MPAVGRRESPGAHQSGPMVDQAVIADFFVAAVLTATPLVFAACGGCFLERAGVYAIALEGMMLMGAFFGVLGANATGSVAVGVVSALAAGASTAIVMVIAAVTLRADQIVT